MGTASSTTYWGFQQPTPLLRVIKLIISLTGPKGIPNYPRQTFLSGLFRRCRRS